MGRSSFEKEMETLRKNIMVGLYNAAVEIEARLREAYVYAIDRFYDDYYPKKYERTYSTYAAADFINSPEDLWYSGGHKVEAGYGASHVRRTDKGYDAKIEISSDFIPGNPYRAKAGKEWVFGRTWEKGIHGYTRNDVIGTNKTRDRYTRWKVNQKDAPRVMKKPPKRLMDSDFKKIAKRKNIKPIVDNSISKATGGLF